MNDDSIDGAQRARNHLVLLLNAKIDKGKKVNHHWPEISNSMSCGMPRKADPRTAERLTLNKNPVEYINKEIETHKMTMKMPNSKNMM
jgi:hypothetical protein